MNIALNIDQYNINNIYFCEPIKNNIVDNGVFIRLIYSTELFVMNGINICMRFTDVNIEKYFNKYKCSFNINNNRNTIETLRSIEENILKKINFNNKTIQPKIYEQIINGNIKIFSENIEKINNQLFILKISGVWETETNIGLTYKFCKTNICYNFLKS